MPLTPGAESRRGPDSCPLSGALRAERLQGWGELRRMHPRAFLSICRYALFPRDRRGLYRRRQYAAGFRSKRKCRRAGGARNPKGPREAHHSYSRAAQTPSAAIEVYLRRYQGNRARVFRRGDVERNVRTNAGFAGVRALQRHDDVYADRKARPREL
jgi:hypothetical protein